MAKEYILVEGERQEVEDKINDLAQQGYELEGIAMTWARKGSFRPEDTIIAAMRLKKNGGSL